MICLTLFWNFLMIGTLSFGGGYGMISLVREVVLGHGCAIVKNAPHEENAKLFLEFIVGEDVQHLLEDQLFRRSVRKDIAGKLPMKELQYDMGRAEESRDEILETWARFNTGADGE